MQGFNIFTFINNNNYYHNHFNFTDPFFVFKLKSIIYRIQNKILQSSTLHIYNYHNCHHIYQLQNLLIAGIVDISNFIAFLYVFINLFILLVVVVTRCCETNHNTSSYDIEKRCLSYLSSNGLFSLLFIL